MIAYRSGEEPRPGDLIDHAEEVRHPEAREWWLVTSIAGDMVRAKCWKAFAWRQAFFTNGMKLLHRREPCEGQRCPICESFTRTKKKALQRAGNGE